MSSVQLVLLEPARITLAQIGYFLNGIFLMLFILLIGWLIAKGIKAAVTKGLRAAKLDEISDRIGLDGVLDKGGIHYSISELVGVICYWLALLVTFMIAFNSVGLTTTAVLLNNVVNYIPNIISAIFILIVGMFVATLMKNIVGGTAKNAGLSQADLLVRIVEFIVMIFAILVALEQLKIGVKITEITISIVLASIGLATALAFGLGCKEQAGRFMNELVEKLKKK